MAFNYLTIVFSLLADFTIFDSTIGPLQILGVFVTSAGLLSGMFIKKEIKWFMFCNLYINIMKD